MHCRLSHGKLILVKSFCASGLFVSSLNLEHVGYYHSRHGWSLRLAWPLRGPRGSSAPKVQANKIGTYQDKSYTLSLPRPTYTGPKTPCMSVRIMYPNRMCRQRRNCLSAAVAATAAFHALHVPNAHLRRCLASSVSCFTLQNVPMILLAEPKE